MDDLQEVFEGWLRSRVGDGPVTEGGYETDVEGMRRWRSDCSEFLVWLQANEPEMWGEFRYRYSSLDSEGWDALVGFGGDYHDEPRLESDLEALVDNPVGEDVPAPTVTTPAPTTTTTTPPPTTTKPPRTIPVTPDTGPEVTAPPTTTVPPPTTTRPEHPSSIWPREEVPEIQHAPFPLPGRGDLAGIPHVDPLVEGRATALGEDFERPQRLRQRPITGLPMQEGRPGDWPWPGGSAGRAIVTNLELSENGRFLAVVMNDLFDWMNSAPPSLLPGYEQPSGSEGFPTVDENGQWLRPGRQPLVPS